MAISRLIFAGLVAVFICFLALLPLRAFAWGEVPAGQPVKIYTGYAQFSNPKGGAMCQRTIVGKAGELAGQVASCAQEAGRQTRNEREVMNANGTITVMLDTYTTYWNGSSVTFSLKETVVGCPAGSTMTNGACYCNSGKMPDGQGGCGANDCKAVANAIRGQMFDIVGTGTTACIGDCVMSFSFSSTFGGYTYLHGDDAKATGATCTGSNRGTGSDINPAPTKCPRAQCPGTVNGQQVCVPCESTSTPGPEVGASGPGGSTSTTTDTTCSNGTCITREITRDPSGNVVSEKITKEPQEDFCQKNPKNLQCQQPSFGGSCDSSFQCEGDAVQCAIAKEQHKRSCEFFAPTGDAVEEGKRAGGAGLRPGDHPGNDRESSTFGLSSMLDQSNPLGGSCPSDYVVSISGRSVAIPFSKMCEPLQWLGRISIAMCLLVAGFVVFRH